jgi:TolA-binding protein
MTPRRFALPATALALLLLALPVVAQTPMEDPLDARDGRRLDKMEKVVRELRAIVFQGRDTGKPVVVQPAETDYQLQAVTRRVEDLEQALTRVNGQLETTNHDLDQARRDAESLRAGNKALTDRLSAIEQRDAPPPPPPPTEGEAAAPSASAADMFAQARQLMLAGDYDGAERGWRG